MAVTLPNLLGGRGSSAQGQRAAFKVSDVSPLALANAGYHRLASRPAVTRPAARQISTISTGPERVSPSEHFVSTSAQPAAPSQPKSAAPQATYVRAQPASDGVHSTAGSVRSTTSTGTTFLAATHSTPKRPPTHQGMTEATLARAQSSAHHPAASRDGGGGLAGPTRPATHHQGHPSHGSGSGTSGGDSNNRSGSTHSNSGTSHSSSGASHSAANSGGAAIRSQPGSGSSHRTGPGGYVNPLAHASVTPERIDQGVDYAGSGPLEALGDGQITYVGTTNTGWPGAFIEFRLLNGPDAGRYVYYAENIGPAKGLHVGQKVSAGQTIATIYSGGSGIEIGWGANVGTETYAMQHGQWGSNSDSNNVATPAGRNFSALIASLGGPPGKVEG